MRQEAYVVEHLGQEPSDVGAPREAEEVDLVPRAVEAHQESIATHDVLIEAAAHSRVLHLEVPGPNAGGLTRVRERAGYDVCADLQVCYELLGKVHKFTMICYTYAIIVISILHTRTHVLITLFGNSYPGW